MAVAESTRTRTDGTSAGSVAANSSWDVPGSTALGGRVVAWIGFILIGLIPVFAVRLASVLGTGFPLNDGGLFHEFVEEIAASSYSLPASAMYNGHQIPFAYPPAGLYLAALLADSFQMSITDIERLIPLLASLATVPIAYLLFRELLRQQWRAAIAVVAFGLMPRSYDWMIAGGGITRSVGLLGASAFLWLVLRALDRPSLWWGTAAGAVLALTALTHPQAGAFAALSAPLLLLVRRPATFASLIRTASAVGATAVALTAPWLITVLLRHGADTLLGAAQTGGDPLEGAFLLISIHYTGGLYEVLSVAAAFGLFVTVVNRHWLVPAWFVVICITQSRVALTYATLPLAIAVVYATSDLHRIFRMPEPRELTAALRRPFAIVVFVILVIVGTADSLASRLNPWSPLHSVSPGERAAMEWIQRNTRDDDSFLLLTGTVWPLDATSEWFPVIAERRSVATVQGTEWLGPGVFRENESRYLWLQSCVATTDRNCVDEWIERHGPVTHVMAVDSRVARLEGHACCVGFAERLAERGNPVVYRATGVRVIQLEATGSEE